MDGGTIAAWVGIGMVTAFSIGSSITTRIIANREKSEQDRRKSERDGVITEKLQNLEDSSNKLFHGVDDVKKEVGRMRENCVKMTSKFSTEISNLQKEANSRKE